MEDGYIGSGRLEGLGYDLDANQRVKGRDTSARSVGDLAPFVHVDVSLVDLATGTLLKRTSISSGQVIGASNHPNGVHPWDAVSSEGKVATLQSMLTSELQDVVPALIGGTAPKAVQ